MKTEPLFTKEELAEEFALYEQEEKMNSGFKITNEIIANMIRDREIRLTELRKFWSSDKFDKMIQDIITSDKIMSSEGWSYLKNQYRSELNWNSDITDEDVTMFFDCLTDNEFPIDKEDYIDPECDWDNITHFRRGLEISIIHGQGTAVIVRKCVI